MKKIYILFITIILINFNTSRLFAHSPYFPESERPISTLITENYIIQSQTSCYHLWTHIFDSKKSVKETNLLVYDIESDTIFNFQNLLKPRIISGVNKNDTNIFIFGTGLLILDSLLKPLHSKLLFSNYLIYSISVKDNLLWLCTNKGLIKYNYLENVIIKYYFKKYRVYYSYIISEDLFCGLFIINSREDMIGKGIKKINLYNDNIKDISFKNKKIKKMIPMDFFKDKEGNYLVGLWEPWKLKYYKYSKKKDSFVLFENKYSEKEKIIFRNSITDKKDVIKYLESFIKLK